MPHFHTYPKLYSKALMVGYENKGKISNAFGEVSYTLSDRENHLRNLHLFCKTYKTLDRWSIKERMIGDSVKTVLSYNRPRAWKSYTPHKDQSKRVDKNVNLFELRKNTLL